MKSFILFLLFPVIIFAQDFNYVVPNPSLEYSTNYFLGWDGTDMYATNPPPVIIEAFATKKLYINKMPPTLPKIYMYRQYKTTICIENENQTNIFVVKTNILDIKIIN